MEPLATLEELIAVLDWDLSDAEKADAEDAIDHLSNLARVYGKPWPVAVTAPRIVRSTVRRAARRFMSNSDGLTQSRAGDETLGWDGIGDKAGTPYFTDDEIKLIRMTAGANGLASVSLTAWGGSAAKHTSGYVPVAGGGSPFPMFDPRGYG